MKTLTTNDLAALRQLWQQPRMRRSELDGQSRRACDRLVGAGMLQIEEGRDEISGQGYHVFVYDPFHAATAGDPAILRQVLDQAPELLFPRPTGGDAQKVFRLFGHQRRQQPESVTCPNCGAHYQTDLTSVFNQGADGAVFTCYSCGHRWGLAFRPFGEKGDRTQG